MARSEYWYEPPLLLCKIWWLKQKSKFLDPPPPTKTFWIRASTVVSGLKLTSSIHVMCTWDVRATIIVKWRSAPTVKWRFAGGPMMVRSEYWSEPPPPLCRIWWLKQTKTKFLGVFLWPNFISQKVKVSSSIYLNTCKYYVCDTKFETKVMRLHKSRVENISLFHLKKCAFNYFWLLPVMLQGQPVWLVHWGVSYLYTV